MAAEGEGSDSDDETETASELDSYAANAAPKREEKPREASPPAQRKAGGDTGAYCSPSAGNCLEGACALSAMQQCHMHGQELEPTVTASSRLCISETLTVAGLRKSLQQPTGCPKYHLMCMLSRPACSLLC